VFFPLRVLCSVCVCFVLQERCRWRVTQIQVCFCLHLFCLRMSRFSCSSFCWKSSTWSLSLSLSSLSPVSLLSLSPLSFFSRVFVSVAHFVSIGSWACPLVRKLNRARKKYLSVKILIGRSARSAISLVHWSPQDFTLFFRVYDSASWSKSRKRYESWGSPRRSPLSYHHHSVLKST